MTYMVAWDLGVEPNGENEFSIKAALFTTEVDAHVTLGDLVSFDGNFVENVSDDNPLADFLPLSRRFPRALFVLTRTDCEETGGPDEPPYERYYVKDGRYQQAEVEVVFTPFEEGRLRGLEGVRE